MDLTVVPSGNILLIANTYHNDNAAKVVKMDTRSLRVRIHVGCEQIGRCRSWRKKWKETEMNTAVCEWSSRLTPLAAWQTSDSLRLSLTQLCKNTHCSPFSECTHIHSLKILFIFLCRPEQDATDCSTFNNPLRNR